MQPSLAAHPFLKDMYADRYFPKFLVDKGKQIFVKLCEDIEAQRPADDASVLALTHAATEAFNVLNEEFYANDSEIETAAREAIAADFGVILKAYGFTVDVESAIAPRDW